MRFTRVGFDGLTLLLVMPGLGALSHLAGVRIEIDVYNYSAVSAGALAGAEQETSRIFNRIDVATEWVVCPVTPQEAIRNRACARPDAPTRFTLRLLTNSMADALQAGPDIFGSARLPNEEAFGVVADIYPDRARELASGLDFQVLLGRVIAHELGHLLLGKNAHSAAGIMHARWRSQDLEPTKASLMLFLTGEAKRIRAQVLARMGADGSP